MAPRVIMPLAMAWPLAESFGAITRLTYCTMAGITSAKDRACSRLAAYSRATLPAMAIARALATKARAAKRRTVEQRKCSVSRV